jgi:hypothetical protein
MNAIDRLTSIELLRLANLTMNKNTIQENIKRLIKMEMDIDVEFKNAWTEIMKSHNLDVSMAEMYKIQPNGEITI